MRINPISTNVVNFQAAKNVKNNPALKYSSDVININKNTIGVERQGKNLHVSFTGNFQNPVDAGIQFKVAGVTRHQKGMGGAHAAATDDNLVRLAKSDWKDGQKLDYAYDETTKNITLKAPEFGEIGTVPASVAESFMNVINTDKDNFQFELTNVTGGVTSDFPIIAAKANLKYIGKDAKVKENAQNAFNALIDSKDAKVSSSVSAFQPDFSPKQVLEKIFDVEGQRNGLGEVRKIKDAVDTIVKEIQNPKNKNILVLGHCSPDGDTVGCVIGMTAALKGAYPDRNIDASIDDDIPNSFSKVPGVEDIKRPYNAKAVNSVKKNIEMLEKSTNPAAAKQIETLNKELEKLTDKSRFFDPNTVDGKDAKKYDLVIMLDTPTQGRSSRAFKPYFENAGKTIFIDHHPLKQAEWAGSKEKLGFDMNQVIQDKLALVVDSVPAATQIVTAVCDKAGMLGEMFKNSAENAKKFVAGIITGSQTDTCGYKNQANYHPSEARLPQSQKANYYPEGMSNYLMKKLDGDIDKKWMRENLFYELPNQPLTNNLGPKDAVLKMALRGREMYPEIGLGMMSVRYAVMDNILQEAKKQDPNVQMTDVYNSFKNSEVMSALKANPTFTRPNPNPVTDAEKAAETYRSAYDKDRVAVFMAQNQVEGSVNKFSQIADKNMISFSFRSGGETNAAQVLATVFGGGGHAAAAGANLSMKGLDFKSKLTVKVDGQVADAKTVYEAANNNVNVSNNNKINFKDKAKMMKKIEIEMSKDGTGRTCGELIKDVLTEMRAAQPVKTSTYGKRA
ncbi:DHH family phosphoesterase [bacterium]|nr:DHH family phosphoesterase [bacterium]